MLMILFHVDDQSFAIDCRHVLEVLPLVKLLNVPHRDDKIAGIATINGVPITMYDFTQMMTKRASAHLLTTRILMLSRQLGSETPLALASSIGLIVEKAIEVVEVQPADINEIGQNVKAFDYFDGLIKDHAHAAQIIDVPKLFTFLQAEAQGHAGRA